ncbi:hydroxymyristoyl-ACP dehydratase [Pseudothermotoga hypogea DSM 11164 = NBRC 106472]|uniref:3-hydroxyacyl-[acyl-carrier-protein] dehydratase FabZ n=2 Tax=Pseudothermotoga hypogea TaxID=57487 RepID=A0A0X1KNV6_9THEM|nr:MULTISPECIES: 3-hydroxyacyl-ACP dehydratase FabZ [Pseudothermotoga]AJC72941.1 hydroxymyristoyl-ACP dehydratase [Pseudothermotoga hypogea DSM 11164 = NBRC 106472]MBC7122609.1 3-hydroxyacyl-ACP dehydratase FabZ [Pseudothermotoga sp.]MDI6862010.1 3-hydroxyacyl-ACP dehydratase FabZ [Pseudothermotoga sp.]
MNVEEIMQILPHRFPILLVDRVIERDEKRIVAIKNVTISEIFFLGHFPDYPIYPGVLIIEGMAQTAGLLLLKPEQKLVPLFLGIDNARFKSPVKPGDVLKYEVEVIESKLNVVKVKAKASVDERIVATAELLLGVKKREEQGD